MWRICRRSTYAEQIVTVGTCVITAGSEVLPHRRHATRRGLPRPQRRPVMAKSSVHRLLTLAAAALVLAAGLTVALSRSAAPAHRVDPAVQRKVDEYLAANPGGRQINATEIAYGNGELIVTIVPEAGILGVADCPTGWFCFYDYVNFGYPRGKLSDCGWQDLGNWGWRDRTESVHYNTASGSETFINDAAFVVSPRSSRGGVPRTFTEATP